MKTRNMKKLISEYEKLRAEKKACTFYLDEVMQLNAITNAEAAPIAGAPGEINHAFDLVVNALKAGYVLGYKSASSCRQLDGKE